MARYIVLRVEENETADKLLEKLRAVPAIAVLGLFASATKFCPGKTECGQDRRLVQSKKTGLTHCSVCRKPVSTIFQTPKNLLLPEDLHPRFIDMWLKVMEPYGPPEEVYGKKQMEAKAQSVMEARDKVRKGRRRRERKAARGR